MLRSPVTGAFFFPLFHSYFQTPTQPTMSNATDVPVDGWVSAPDDRGTGDIIWSCGMTILLCCWVSVYPNVGSPSDKWYHPFVDKLNLFCIALLGPDFLFGIAFGQWSKARASVRVREFLEATIGDVLTSYVSFILSADTSFFN